MNTSSERRAHFSTRTPWSALGASLTHILHGRTSADTVQVAGAGIIGAAYLIFLFVSNGALTQFGDLAQPWWLPTVIVVVVLSGLGLVGVAATGRADRLGLVATVSAIAFLVALASWFHAWNGIPMQRDTDDPIVPVWLAMIPGLTSVALMLARRPFIAVLNVVAGGAVGEAVAAQAWTGGLDSEFGVRVLWSVAWTGIYLVLAAAAIGFADRLDAVRSATMQTTLDRARRSERDAEHRRLDALVHDRIIAFLLALTPGRPDPALASAAAGVIDELDHWWDREPAVTGDMSGGELVHRLRTVIAGIGDDVVVRAACSEPEARYAGSVTEALLDATAEAVRNYYRHAGAGSSCAVIADVGPDLVTVTVADDGVGFDPSTTAAGRLGLAFGIVQRMSAIPGGSSRVQSAPGHGTRVRLEWRR